MDIYKYSDYKTFVLKWLEEQPNRGRGVLKKMAEHLRIGQPMLTHVLRGDKHFSFEAAHDVSEFIGLNDEGTDYFLLLVQFARAGSFALRSRLERKVKREQERAKLIAKRVKAETEVDESGKVIFYSNWLYSGVRNMSACLQWQTVDQIAERLHVPRATIQKVVEFLVAQELCVLKNGKLDVGPKQTHVPQNSPHVSRHHQNWRMHAMSKLVDPGAQNLFFTSPMSLSITAAEQIREKLPRFVEEIRDIVRPSDSETVRCLNIDWFEY